MVKVNKESITPALMVANEEYWIYYVLRDLLKVFGNIVLIDTGSIDTTLENVRKVLKDVGGKCKLIHAKVNGPNDIGECRNIMRKEVKTPWMLLVDGDEIWLEEHLRLLLDIEVPDATEVVMVGQKQLQDVNGVLQNRTNDIANRDALFAPNIRWTRTDYPFEGYGLGGDFPMSKVTYIPAHEVFCYHMRHTKRSPQDDRTFFRKEKQGYFPYGGPFEDLPKDWLGEIVDLSNPYLQGTGTGVKNG